MHPVHLFMLKGCGAQLICTNQIRHSLALHGQELLNSAALQVNIFLCITSIAAAFSFLAGKSDFYRISYVWL